MSQPATITAAPETRSTQAQGRHLEAVPEPDLRHTLAYTVLAILIAGAAVFGAVSLNALAAAESVQAEQLETRVAEAQRNHSELVARVGRLEDPDRIREAAGDLGMIPASSRRYLQADQPLPGDQRAGEAIRPGAPTDPLKPVLSVQR